jgi:hypothetical protein
MYDIYQLLHVSAPRYHPKVVIVTNIKYISQHTNAGLLLLIGITKASNAKINGVSQSAYVGQYIDRV